MPCVTEELPHERASRHRKEVEIPTGFLCGLLTALEKEDVLNLWLHEIDWKEVGITKKEAMKWWEYHKKEDRNRRAAENEAAEREKIKATALSKLTLAEKKTLGIK
jgi:hypothetical protein